MVFKFIQFFVTNYTMSKAISVKENYNSLLQYYYMSCFYYLIVSQVMKISTYVETQFNLSKIKRHNQFSIYCSFRLLNSSLLLFPDHMSGLDSKAFHTRLMGRYCKGTMLCRHFNRSWQPVNFAAFFPNHSRLLSILNFI